LKIIQFGSRREDYNRLSSLKDGAEMMTPPRARIMHESIKNLSKDPTAVNIEHLLSVAENNKYGLLPNSALRKYLREQSTITGKLENNNWGEELQNAVKKAVNRLPKNHREKFLSEYDRIFVEQKNLTTAECKIIKYREKIINSKPFTEAVQGGNQNVSKTLKNLDYFIASSETPINIKYYVLSKLNYFLSDEYKIHPQLEDKKFKAFSEIINDLVIKSPEAEFAEAKDCNQKKHGSCAAISAARKALLYEDKKAYIDVLLQELNDKPYLEVYDITRLREYEGDAKKYEKERAPKVKVEKARINYDAALADGYRIIDASVLHWMKVAGTVGDGTVQLEDYIAFDARKNGFMHDSRILRSQDDSYYYDHELLRTLISSRSIIKSYDKNVIKSEAANKIHKKYYQLYAATRDENYTKIYDILVKIAPEFPPAEIKDIIQRLTHSVNVNIKNNDEIYSAQVKKYLTDKLGAHHEKGINKNLKSLLPLIKKYIKSSAKAKAGSKTIASRVNLKEKLFKIGVAQREVLRAQLKFDAYINDAYDELHMPDRATQIKNRVKYLQKLLKNNPKHPVILELKAKNEIDDNELAQRLATFDKDFTTVLPSKMDEYLGLFKTNYKDVLTRTMKSRLQAHREGNYAYMNSVSSRLKFLPDAQKFDKRLSSVINELEKAQSNEELNNALIPLGTHNQYSITAEAMNDAVKTIFDLLDNDGIEDVKTLVSGVENIDDPEEIKAFINTKVMELNTYLNYIESIASCINMPSEEDVILRAYENKGQILSDEMLKNLRAKFDSIYQARTEARNRQAEGKDVITKAKIYKFAPEQIKALKQIEKNLPKFRRDVVRGYDILNRSLKEELEKIYEESGKRKGMFWVCEEGRSGLYSQEQVRIIEQMTGRPYHIEKDFDKAFEQIKNGEGSGVSSTNVDYNDFSGHAQYVVDIKPLSFIDEKTGEKKVQDVLLHDNTWGHGEKEFFWIGKDGLVRTDYANKMGGSKGFIVADNSFEGDFVDNFKYDTGLCDYDKKFNTSDGPEFEMPGVPVRYGVFNEVILRGEDFRTKNKITSITKCIFNFLRASQMINALKTSIEQNNYKVNTKKLDKVDNAIDNSVQGLYSRLVNPDSEKPVITIEQFNKLPKDDPLKVVINKLIIRKRFYELNEDMRLSEIRTQKDLEKYKEGILNRYKNIFRFVLMKDKQAITKEMVHELYIEADKSIAQIEKDLNTKIPNFKRLIHSAIKRGLAEPYDGACDILSDNIVFEIEDTIDKNPMLKKLDNKYVAGLCNAIVETLEDCIIPESVKMIAEQEECKELIKFIENKFNPRTDKEFINNYVDLLNMTSRDLNRFMRDLSFDDLGIKFDTPENVIRLIQSDNSLEIKRFKEEARLHFFDQHLPLEAKNSKLKKVSKEQANFNNIYRSIAIDIGEIGANKYLAEAKDDVFRKYSIRPAIPQVKVTSDTKLTKFVSEELTDLSNAMADFKALNVFKKYQQTVDNINLILDTPNVANIIGVREQLIEKLKSLSEQTENDEVLKATSSAAKSFAAKLKMFPLKSINYKKYMDIINKECESISKDRPINQVVAREKELREDITSNVNSFVESNFLPKHHSQVRRRMNEWMRLLTKGIDSDAIEETSRNLINFMTDKHILNYPQEILSYAVNKTCESVPEEKKDIHDIVVKNLMDYLTQVYTKANRAKLEYKLMSAASKGIAPKIGDALRKGDAQIKFNDGSYINLASDTGMASLANALCDDSNNHSTLMLFLEQAGLKKEMLNALMKSTPEKMKFRIMKKAENINAKAMSYNIINKIYESYIDYVPDEVVQDKQKLIDCCYSYIDAFNTIETDGKISYEMLDSYTNKFRDICEKFDIEEFNLKAAFSQLHNACKELIKRELLATVEDINNYAKAVQNNAYIVESLKFTPGSPEDIKRNEYVEAVRGDVVEYLKTCNENLSPVINGILKE